MAEQSAGLLRLAAALHPLDTDPKQLPVVGYRPDGEDWKPSPAAVLVPICLDAEHAVILTVRSRHLPHHAGQVSLPGGSPNPGEVSPVVTALREANEEIGISVDQVRPLGLLPRCDTITAYRITPVVGLVTTATALQPNPDEVSEAFSVPLARVLDPSSYRSHRIERAGKTFEAWSMCSDHRPIWGATAAILRELAMMVEKV